MSTKADKPVEHAEVRAFQGYGCFGCDFTAATMPELEDHYFDNHPENLNIPGYVQQLRKRIEASRRAAFERAIEIVEQEEREYIANSKACDMAGAHYSASNDIHAAVTCKNVASALRKERDGKS